MHYSPGGNALKPLLMHSGGATLANALTLPECIRVPPPRVHYKVGGDQTSQSVIRPASQPAISINTPM